MSEFQPIIQTFTRQDLPVDDFSVNDPTAFDGVVVVKKTESIEVCYSQSEVNCRICPRSLNCPASAFNRLN